MLIWQCVQLPGGSKWLLIHSASLFFFCLQIIDKASSTRDVDEEIEVCVCICVYAFV